MSDSALPEPPQPPVSPYVLGIDAGATKTVGLLADLDGRVVRRTRAPGANLRLLGELGVEKVVYQVVEALGAPLPLAAVCLGMAGVSGDEEREVIRGVMRRLGQRDHVRIENDAFVALVAGSPSGRGIVLVAGTGSIAYGVDDDGKVARSGGWGYILGDEGSAYWLGRAAIRVAVRYADGRGPETLLYEKIIGRLQLAKAARLVEWFYDQEHSRSRIARLAELVEEAAAEGDAEAAKLLDVGAEHLALAARAVADKLSFRGPYPVVLAGGTFRACPSLYERLEKRPELPRGEVVRLAGEPAEGAVELARQMVAGAAAGR